MNVGLARLLAFVAVVCTSCPARGDEVDDLETRRAASALRICTAYAKELRLTAGTDGGGPPLELHATPILRWSNPVAGSLHGCVFLWTDDGRPRAVASIYQWFDPFDHAAFEFHSLAPGPLRAVRGGRVCWKPSAAGLEFAPLPDADRPALHEPNRLLQMRVLARRFSASKTGREGQTRRLRLLPQPLYRYGSRAKDPLDGAVFGFVHGTDPEVFLLVEAQRGGDEPAWHYAAARMNSIRLELALDGRDVWTVDQLPWKEVRDPSAVYSSLSLKNGGRP